MTGVLDTASVSRRTAAIALGLGGLSTLLGRRLELAAQEATPVDDAISRTDHPLIGPWEWHTSFHAMSSQSLNVSPESSGIFAPDGTYLEHDLTEGVGIGFWWPTGERTADLVAGFQRLGGDFQRIEGPTDVFERGYVPESATFQGHIAVIRQAVRVGKTNVTLRASGSFEIWRFDNLVFSDMFARKASRLSVAEEGTATPES